MNIGKNIQKNFVTLLLTTALGLLIYFQLRNNQQRIDELIKTWESFLTKSPLLMITALALTPLGLLVEAMKWRYMANLFSHMSLGRAYASVLTGISFAFVSPAKSGAFAGRMLYFPSNTRMRAAIAVLVGNLSHIMVTFCLGVVGALVLLLYSFGWWQLGIFAGAAAVTLVFGYFYFNIHRLESRRRWKHPLVRKVFLALKVLKRFKRKELLIISIYSLLKIVTFNIQYLIIVYLMGGDMNWYIALFFSFTMFFMIVVIPSFFVADIVIRGYLANLLFVTTGFCATAVPVIAGSYSLWIINWVLPAILGGIVLLIFRFFFQTSTQRNIILKE